MAKKIVGFVKLQVPAGKANPSPPIGPALGQRGLNIMEFCKAFNAQTQGVEPGLPLPVVITAYADKSFTFVMKTPPATVLIKKAAKLEKGSPRPHTDKVGKITRAQAEEILKDAIQKDPERQELKLKLLEIYQTTGNKAAFESLASDVYAKAGPADVTWSKVSVMGQKLDPDNALYQSVPAATSDATIDVASAAAVALPVTEAQSEEDAYHFNFEAPALEFDGASEAVAAASAEPEKLAERTGSTAAAEEISMASIADTPSAVSDAEAVSIDTSARDDNDTTLEFLSTPPSASAQVGEFTEAAETLRFEVEPGVEVEPGAAIASASDDLSVDSDLALTPKALDLPSLNLEDEAQSADAGSSQLLSATTGEQTLSTEDAVFESLPELSLELGSPSADRAEQATEDGLEIEEISLGSAEALLNESPAVDVMADSAFPEISLDVAEASAASAESITDEPEEVNTKLDLIQAYIDMEDVVGAKELIDEVMAEGGERQQQRANELLAKIV